MTGFERSSSLVRVKLSDWLRLHPSERHCSKHRVDQCEWGVCLRVVGVTRGCQEGVCLMQIDCSGLNVGTAASCSQKPTGAGLCWGWVGSSAGPPRWPLSLPLAVTRCRPVSALTSPVQQEGDRWAPALRDSFVSSSGTPPPDLGFVLIRRC